MKNLLIFGGIYVKKRLIILEILYFLRLTFLRLHLTFCISGHPLNMLIIGYISTEAPDIESFSKLLTVENISKLESDNGVCIIYTHFGNGFVKDGILDERFKSIISYLAARNGWYVPASELLDYIQKHNNKITTLSYFQEFYLSFKWLVWKLFHGTS